MVPAPSGSLFYSTSGAFLVISLAVWCVWIQTPQTRVPVRPDSLGEWVSFRPSPHNRLGMQETYRPRRIKYSICYPRWGTPRQGTPLARSDGGVPKVGYPRQGTPWPGLRGYPRWGTPQPGLMGGYLRWGTPQQGTPPSGPGRSTAPPQVWTDRHVSKHNLPVVLRTRSVKKSSTIVGNWIQNRSTSESSPAGRGVNLFWIHSPTMV